MLFLRQTFIVFRRQLRIALRNPAWVIIGLVQPIRYLALFGPLLVPLAGTFGADNAYTLFVPGLLVQLGLFGTLFAGFGLVAEWRAGVIEAERVTPASRTALLFGRVALNAVQLLVQSIVLVLLSFLFGLQASAGGIVFGVALTVLLGAACACFSDAVGLLSKSENVLAPLLNSVSLPVLLLSGILLPITQPQWLRTVADVVPTKHIVDGIRTVFTGTFDSTVWWGSFWAVVVFAAAAIWGTRVFRRENA
jgi:ABC-2 type transport system permease protein